MSLPPIHDSRDSVIADSSHVSSDRHFSDYNFPNTSKGTDFLRTLENMEENQNRRTDFQSINYPKRRKSIEEFKYF